MQEEKTVAETKLKESEVLEPEGAKKEDISKEELVKKLNEKSEEAALNHDRWLRASAELENYKKRIEKEKAEYLKYANESLIKELLSTVDDLERAIEHAQGKKTASEALTEGVEMVLKNLTDCLAKFGLTPIKTVGERFDPNLHEAVMVKEDPEKEENTILSCLQKGYVLKGRVIRPAIVEVSRLPAQNEEKDRNMKEEVYG